MIKIDTTKSVAYNKKKTKTDLSKINTTPDRSKNQGGFLGGLGYVGGNIAAGLGGIVEGVIDASIAPLADLFGDHEYAKYLFKNNVVGDWHKSITEEYNPTGFVKFLGDVGHGLGQSSVLLIPYAGAPMFFQGIISQSISGAVEHTGDVGVKEAAYGFTSGAIEAGLEYVLGAAGKGAKSIGSAIAKNTGKGAVKRVTSSAVRKGLVGKVISSATGEFFEEAASEIIDVGLQKAYQINPDAKINWNDVLYAGVVGAVSGAVMGGSIEGIQTLQNRSAGQKIIRDGNAQTLVNTATAVADKLAKQGTNFKKAPEWVKTLRGEVDAYNKLVEKGQQTSASAETILGEMKASLFFAEIQSAHYGLTENIKNSSEENRATLAAYVNKSIDKKNRPRDYTADDIANDTDGIATQLGIMQFASPTFINYADAISSLEADQTQESAIGDVVGAMQQESAETQAEQSGAVQGEAVPAAEAVTVNQESGVGGVANQANTGIFNANAGVIAEGEVAKSDLASPLEGAKYSVATAKKAKAKIKENAARAERTRQARFNEEEQTVEGASKERSAESEILEQKSEENADKTVESKTKEKSAERKNEADKPVIRKPKEALTDKQRAERAVKRAEKLIEWENKTQPTTKELNTAREYIKDFDSLPPSMRTSVIKMLRSADGKVDKNTLKGVANLMTLRRRDGRLVMPDLEFRFAEGIGDGGLYTHIGEGENRRVLILINSDAGFKETIRGTIAHEVVHYIENRKGYRELADYVLKTAKKEKIAEIEGEYNEHYKGIYTAEAKAAGLVGDAITKKVAERMATEEHRELIESEVVAKLIGLRLNNEKFLKKYATKDDAMIKKIFRFLRATVSYLKDKDKATSAEIENMVNIFSIAISSEVTGDSEGTRTAFDANSSSDKQQKAIENNIKNVKQMLPVANISGEEFKKSEVDLVTQVSNFFDDQGNVATSLELGEVIFDRRGVKDDIAHGIGRKKAASFAAVPDVIKNGKVVDYQKNWKNRGYDTAVIAAPIEINGEPHLMGIVLIKEQGNQRFYVHEVLSIAEGAPLFKTGANTKNGDSGSDAPSVISILQKIAVVNSSDEKKDLTRTNSEKMQVAKSDIAPRKKKAKTVDKSKLNENGEVKDEFFAEAVRRMYQDEARRAQNTAEAYKEGNKILNKKIDTMKQQHEALVAEVIELEDRVHFLESKTEAYVEGNQTLSELLSAARKRRNNAVMKLEEVRAELRQMGYDLEAEKRKVKRREDQIDKQKKMLKDAEREKARLEREFKLLSEVEAREIARLKKQLAKERSEIGKVYSESEIRREIKTMMESGLISKFFGGQYKPNLPMEKLNLIARYIAIELNTAGTAEGKRADALLEKAADEIVARLKFTDEDSGKKYVIRDLVDAETLEQFMDFAKTDIRDLFNNVGTINAYSELVRQYKLLEQKYNAENDKASEKAAWGKEFPKTYQAAMKVKALAEKNKGAGSDSIQFISKTLASVVDTAGHMNLTKVDEAAKAISDFLDGEIAKEEAERAQLSEGAELTSFSWDTYEMIRSLVNEFIQLREDRIGEQLTSEELRVFGEMLRGMKHVIERYNKEFVGSHLVNADTVVTTEVTDLLAFAARNKEYKTKVGKFLGEKLGKTLNQLYFYNVLSPETVIEAVEGFKKDGLLKTLLHSIREGEQSSRTMAARMKDPFVQYMDDKENVWVDEKGRKHSYRNKLNDKMIRIKEQEISLGEAIYLYMLTKREHSHLGLKDNGYITYNDDGSVKARLFVLDPQMTRTEIESQLDEKDKAFLKMSEAFFNETASKIKYDADIKIFGFSNNQAGYYVPIIRDRYARMNGVSDPRMGISSIITVYNKSFTQALVRNNNALEGKSIMRIINDHADGLADYSELYLPLKAFDRLYNRRVILDDGHATSIRQVLNQDIWNGAETYLTDLFKDVQGQSRGETSVVDAVAGWLRSGWVNSVLGANLKVVATQTTSLAAATQVIEGKYITAALSTLTPGKDVSEIGARADKYSKIIFARHFEMGALKSQGNIDKVNEIGKKTGALIEWMDRRVCLAVFHAAELKAEELGHGAVGTESNSIAAAKIADKAIFTTQAMNGSTERSALQRSKSEIAKMFSMFTADTVKQLSHLYGNTMKYLAHKERAKTDPSYEALLANDKKEMLRSMRTLAIVGVMIGLITQGFKYLYGKEEEEPEDKVKDLAIDVASSTLNILPVWSDVIDKVFLDYDMSVNVLDVANDTLETVSSGFKLAGKLTSGEYVSGKEIGRTAVNIGKSVFSLFGLPVAPVERTVTGLMRRFAPSTIYGYDAMFRNSSYTADLKRAVEKGDEALAEHILTQLYKNEMSGVYASEELEVVADLYAQGYTNVIPQKIGDEINGVKLDRKQRKQFNSIYAKASSRVVEMIGTSEFKALSAEQQAMALKNLYSLYYNRAASTVVGKEVSNAQMYSWLTGNYSVLFTSQAYKSGLDVVKSDKGKEVSVRDQFVEYAQNLGLSESDLLVVKFANGVRDKKTKAAFIEHINTLTLSDEQKAVIAERLSLEFKDGKLVEKKE